MGVPLFDTLLAMTRRWLNHKPLYLADRGHLHHNLVDSGLTKKQAVYVMYGVSCFFGACAIILTKASESQVTTVFVMFLISLVVVAAAELVGIFKKKRLLVRILQIKSKR
ncbi:putative undecaprenyl-phosphate N-acetylglucosaminyl 1-phosphate transferase [compost metagenome]